jgi:thiol:disulfide interchange protein
MAFTFTLVSFTCTFAFAGGVLVLASSGQYFWPMVGMLAFSTAFASPFFFLALFPTLLKQLPKSGGWMNTFKVTMGMIELAAAFKFLSVVDLRWNPVPTFFDYSTVMTAWIVISACTGLYLLGLFRLTHDTPSQSISALRLVFAMGFLSLAGFLGVGLYGTQQPGGVLWAQIKSFAPPHFEGGESDLGPFVTHDGLEYALNFDQAIQYAQDRNQPMFLDFTGVNCVNCRYMEKEKFPKPHNRERLAGFVRVQLYVDNIPHMSDRRLAQRLLERNRDLAENWLGDVTLPAYAVVTPDGKRLLATYMGTERRDGEFAEFLDKGLENWQKVSGKSGSQLARR